MYSWIRCWVDLYVFFLGVLPYYVMLQAFICYCSYIKCLRCMCVCVYVCVCVCVCVCACACVCVCVVHLYCSAQLSMFNMEKHYRNKIIIITTNFQIYFSLGLKWCLAPAHLLKIHTVFHNFACKVFFHNFYLYASPKFIKSSPIVSRWAYWQNNHNLGKQKERRS